MGRGREAVEPRGGATYQSRHIMLVVGTVTKTPIAATAHGPEVPMLIGNNEDLHGGDF